MINQKKRLLCYNQTNLKRAMAIISQALRNNKFYQKKFKTAGITKTINNWGDFYKLPFTAKEELVQDQIKHPPFGTNISCKENKIIHFTTTSGSSTGHKLIAAYTKRDFKSMVGLYEFVEKNYIKIKQSDVVLPLFELKGCLLFQITLSLKRDIRVILPPNDNIPEIYKDIKKFGATVILGYPTQILELIKYADKEGIDLTKLKVRKLYMTGEPGWTNKKLRRFVEKKLSAEWNDQLGATETMYTARACNKCQRYHFYPNSVIAEIIDPKTGLHSDEGELVETSLIKTDIPYIRYNTNSLVKISYSPICRKITFNGILGRTKSLKTFRSENLNTIFLENQIKAINPTNNFLVLLYKKNNLDAIDIFYETKSNSEIAKLHDVAQQFNSQYYYYPKILSLHPGRIQVEKKGVKIKTVYDLRSNDIPNFNYKKLYSLSRYDRGIFRVVSGLKKILNIYK